MGSEVFIGKAKLLNAVNRFAPGLAERIVRLSARCRAAQPFAPPGRLRHVNSFVKRHATSHRSRST
jgi:hypothetical protein